MTAVARFDLTAPCAHCPFRSDIPAFLTKGRAEEITRAIVDRDGSFPCHKTVSYRDDSRGRITRRSQHCAGAMIMLEWMKRPNQAMRIAGRLRIFDPAKLKMDAPVFRTSAAFIEAQGR